MWRVRRRDEWKLGRNCVSNSFCQVSNNNGTSEVRKSSYICFTLQSSMTLNLILRRWSPSEQPLRHKQIVFQPPASHRLRPAHLVHPRGHGWGSKGAHRSIMRSGTATAFIWTGAHLCDTHLLHLKETRLSVENSYMLFIMCRGVESLSGNSDLVDEFSLEMSPRPNYRGRQLKIQSLQSRVGVINLGKHLS